MMTALVLAGIVAAPVSTAALFLPARQPRNAAGTWPAIRRSVTDLAGTALLGALTAAVLLLLGVARSVTWPAVAGLAASSLAWMPATRRWNARSHLAWAASLFLFATYLAYILWWTFASHLGVASTAGGLVLWLLEVAAAVLACAYLWELCDALGTQHWRRRITAAVPTPEPGGPPPFVSLHVPAHNEPPDMVIETLESLLRIDYPAYEVIAIDDNTEDEAMWRPVQRWCAGHGVKFEHLQDWPGYKSGALNYALQHLTDERAEIVGVVDSDYQIDPGFLARCAPLLTDPRVGFIQAPQDYRDWQHAPYYRRLYYSYRYFFAVSQPSRNERDGAIFAGTMGLIRRQALEQAGGWDEWCITEDAELSLRLLRDGWSGLHVDQSWGQGIMPLTFESLKSQRYRWCFGGIQILRMHWRSMLPGGRTRHNSLSLGQRWTYLTGAIQWYGDLLGLTFFLFLLAGAGNLGTGGGQLFRKLTPFLVSVVPMLVALGLIRAVALLRRGTGATWRDAIGAFFIWQSTALAVARASVAALFAREAVFLRTPKTGEASGWRQALRGNWAETALAVAGLAGIAAALSRTATLSGPLLAGLLLFPTLGMAAAPFNSLAAARAALPAHLRQRRQTEALRDRRALVRGAAAGGLITAAAGTAAVALLMLPGPSAPPLHLLPPGRGGLAGGPTRSSSPSGRPTPAPGRRASAGSSPASSPTPTPSPSGPASPSAVTPSPSGTAVSPSPTASGSVSPSPSPSPGSTPGPSATPTATAPAAGAPAS